MRAVSRFLHGFFDALTRGRLARGRAVVFMFHRFADPARGVDGHDPLELKRVLQHLRQRRYEVLPLETLIRLLTEDRPIPDRAVAFTIDDGYADQAEVAIPIFSAFDCPVTMFLTTSFIDQRLWMWWDQIEHVFRHTRRSQVHVRLGQHKLTYPCVNDLTRSRATTAFVERCKKVEESEKASAIRRLASAAEVELPRRPPPCYAPMTWDAARRLERRGVSFAPHTVTHPILARVTEQQSRNEIVQSLARLGEELSHPLPIFAYPNGRTGDFGPREFVFLRESGYRAALSSEPGYAERIPGTGDLEGRYSIRRFPYPDDLPAVIQLVSGFELVKARVRRLGTAAARAGTVPA